MIVHGQDEALKWMQRVGQFRRALGYAHTLLCCPSSVAHKPGQVHDQVHLFPRDRDTLGDRKLCSYWGGSVLDSVVGTFLTQNVSDALSSKAYMTLASRFPARKPGAAGPAAGEGGPSPAAPSAPHTPWSRTGYQAPPWPQPERATRSEPGASLAPRCSPKRKRADAEEGCSNAETLDSCQAVPAEDDFADVVDWEAVMLAPMEEVNLYGPARFASRLALQGPALQFDRLLFQ